MSSAPTDTQFPLVCDDPIREAVDALGDGPLTHDALRRAVDPLFSRVIQSRDEAPEPRPIYLANHSLGRPLDLVADEVRTMLDAWYTQLDGAWMMWTDRIERYRSEVASLLGIENHSCVVPKTSAAQGLRAVLNALPAGAVPNIVSTRAEFDSIDFVLKAYHHKGRANVHFVETNELGMVDESYLLNAINDETDVVVCSIVCFAMGQQLTRLREIVHAARKHGALIVLDSYHAMGVLKLDDAHRDADFIIGGNYKYTRGGPGACFLAINPRHLTDAPRVPNAHELSTTDTGWFAKHDTFGYTRPDDPVYASGGDAWLEATPPVLTMAQSLPGLVLTNALGVDRLRAYTRSQTEHLTNALRQHGVVTATPEHYGAYILVRVPDAKAAAQACADHGIIADARPSPSGADAFLRLCPDILTTDDELDEAADRVARALLHD